MFADAESEDTESKNPAIKAGGLQRAFCMGCSTQHIRCIRLLEKPSAKSQASPLAQSIRREPN